MNILFYIVGFISGILALSVTFLRNRIKDKDILISKLEKENLDLSKFKQSRESKKRIAKILTKGWYKVKEEKNPRKHTWNVSFELREVAVSEDDENKVKFEVVDVYSENASDIEKDINEYKKWFLSNHGGGWIDTKNPDFEWITLLSKTEIREDKINNLLS